MTGTPIVERRRFHPPMTTWFSRYLRWWPICIFAYYLVVSIYPPASFRNTLSLNVYAWLAWVITGLAVLALIFPYKLSIKSMMCALATSRAIAAIASTMFEQEQLHGQNLFWYKFFLLNSSLALTLLWVGMYAVTIPYMKELEHERH